MIRGILNPQSHGGEYTPYPHYLEHYVKRCSSEYEEYLGDAEVWVVLENRSARILRRND